MQQRTQAAAELAAAVYLRDSQVDVLETTGVDGGPAVVVSVVSVWTLLRAFVDFKVEFCSPPMSLSRGRRHCFIMLKVHWTIFHLFVFLNVNRTFSPVFTSSCKMYGFCLPQICCCTKFHLFCNRTKTEGRDNTWQSVVHDITKGFSELLVLAQGF